MNARDSEILAAAARRMCYGDPAARAASAPSLDRAQELDAMSTDANQGQQAQDPNQAHQPGQQPGQAAPQGQQPGQQPGQAQQAPAGQPQPGQQAQAQQGQQGQAQAGQLSDQQAEQVARQLIENQPQLIAPVLGHPAPAVGHPMGTQAAPGAADLMAHLPQAIAFVRAFVSALQAAGVSIPGL